MNSDDVCWENSQRFPLARRVSSAVSPNGVELASGVNCIFKIIYWIKAGSARAAKTYKKIANCTVQSKNLFFKSIIYIDNGN